MATNKELESRLEQLEEQNRLLRQLVPGLEGPSDAIDIKDRADYIEHGSEKHATFIGLVEVDESEMEDAEKMQYVLYESPKSGKIWRLEDELGIQQAFPGLDPTKVSLMVLRQKVSSFDAGKPPIPATAQPLLVPQTAF